LDIKLVAAVGNNPIVGVLQLVLLSFCSLMVGIVDTAVLL